MSSVTCELVAVGTELLAGKVNTHVSRLSQRLSSIGILLKRETTVGDDQAEITRVIQEALQRSAIVLVTGGLGPTFDDLTREAASESTGRPLVRDAKLVRVIQAKFRAAGCRMSPENLRQADILQGARSIPNRVGTAPGQILVFARTHFKTPPPLRPAQVHRRLFLGRPQGGRGGFETNSTALILLPGPWRELSPMLEERVLPFLKKTFHTRAVATRSLHASGVPESLIDHAVRPLFKRIVPPQGVRLDFTILARPALVDLYLRAQGGSAAVRRRTLRKLLAACQRRLRPWVYGFDGETLEEVVGRLLKKKRWTLATAESCTGGLLAGRLTDVSGSSAYFKESVVTYANEAKVRWLDVSPQILTQYGAVSRSVAFAMARGVRNRTRSDVGVAVTGIAGPTGGTPKKPVGTVVIAVQTPRTSRCETLRLGGDRFAVRERSVVAALNLLRVSLRGGRPSAASQ